MTHGIPLTLKDFPCLVVCRVKFKHLMENVSRQKILGPIISHAGKIAFTQVLHFIKIWY